MTSALPDFDNFCVETEFSNTDYFVSYSMTANSFSELSSRCWRDGFAMNWLEEVDDKINLYDVDDHCFGGFYPDRFFPDFVSALSYPDTIRPHVCCPDETIRELVVSLVIPTCKYLSFEASSRVRLTEEFIAMNRSLLQGSNVANRFTLSALTDVCSQRAFFRSLITAGSHLSAYHLSHFPIGSTVLTITFRYLTSEAPTFLFEADTGLLLTSLLAIPSGLNVASYSFFEHSSIYCCLFLLRQVCSSYDLVSDVFWPLVVVYLSLPSFDLCYSLRLA
jgi:hypothetical protein